MGGALNRVVSRRRLTLEDVAEEAGVSLATADRVVNRRDGVRAGTAERVEKAITKLGYRASLAAVRLARNRKHRFAFVLPSTANPFMSQLASQVAVTADWLASQQGFIDVMQVDVFDPDALSSTLEALDPVYHGVALVALDHPKVRGAIDDLVARGVHVVTLVSDVPSSKRTHYVGIDNPAAGRTAGSLMGRFLAGREARIGVTVGSMGLRDHAERYFGFHQVVTREYPNLTIVPVLEGRDDDARNRKLVSSLISRHPDIAGLYNVGAGNAGIVTALEASGRASEIVFIAHELTALARRCLISGIADAIINQDAGHEARSAARILLARCENQGIIADQERIRVEIFLRDNLP